MKNLEDKILDRMYAMETKKTSLSLFGKILLFTVSAFLAYILLQVLVEVFIEGNTFSVFEIFQDDIEVIIGQIGTIAYVVFEETPKLLLAFFIAAAVAACAVLLTFVRNFGKMRHKIASIIRYRLRDTKGHV